MKNKEKTRAVTLKRLAYYVGTLIPALLAFFGTVLLLSGRPWHMPLTLAYVVVLFLAFTSFLFASVLRKTSRRRASQAGYCVTVIFNGISSGLLTALVLAWLEVTPSIGEMAICAGSAFGVLVICASLVALTRKRAVTYFVLATDIAAIVFVVKRLVELDFRNAFYLVALCSMIYVLFRMVLAAFIISDSNYLRSDALLSFGVALLVGAIALVIFSDGTPKEALIEAGVREEQKH